VFSTPEPPLAPPLLAGWLGWSPMLCDVVLAFDVEEACTSGAIFDASGPAEAPEFVTA
jgi:hypothetical protein